nr:integrase, catalytic region, zinc finger, CCHC-type, peptidase aspartic, catalytic [Tanacetum cinerariifolium]
MRSDQEKRIQKIDRLARSLMIQGLPNDIYSLTDSNKTAKDLWDALARHMLGSEYGEQVRKAAQNQGDVNDAMGSKKKTVVVTSDPLALIAKKTKVSKSKEKVVVSLDSEESEADDFSELKKITAMLAKAFNRRKFYSKPTNNNLRTSSTSQSANKKQEFVKTDNKKVKKKDDEKKKMFRKRIGFENPSYFEKAKDLRPTLYDEKTKLQVFWKKKKTYLETIKSLKSKGFESSENVSSELENHSEDDCLMVEKECHKEENPKVIAPGMFKLSVSQCVLPISMTKSSCDSKNVEIKLKRKRHNGKSSKQDVKQVNNDKKGSSNTSNVDLSAVSVSKLNKNVKRYSRKDLLACNNSYLGETSGASVCNDAINVFCNSRMCDLLDDNNFFIFDDECVKISPVSKMSFRKKPRDSMNIVQICLWIIDSGCSKHMTGNNALLTNCVEKFLGTVRFGNNDFAMIVGYEDVVIGSMTIKKFYYVEGLGHDLFSVGQVCDKGLEVAFRKSTCFIRNEDGVDLLTGDRSSNLYTIALNEVASNSSTCLLAKASSS